VPWEVVEPGSDVDAPLILFWLPASAEELRRSELLVSRDLALFSAQCVAMRVVPVHDDVRMARLAADEVLPLAVLTDRHGEVVGRVASDGAELLVAAVEELVREELQRRAADADARLDRASERAQADDVGSAVALYESVWNDRCVCPRQGRDAGRALRKLRK
jgi:hypothetical protein